MPMRKHALGLLCLAGLTACMPPGSASLPPEARQQLTEARALAKAGNTASAIGIYNQIVSRNPEALEPALELAALYRRAGQGGQALRLMQDEQKRYPDNQQVSLQLGYALIEANQPEEAVAAFDALLARDPANAAALNGKGVAFDHAGNHLAAQDLYQDALQLSPDSESVQNNLAMSMILNKQYAAAIPLLEKLDKPGSNPKIHRNLALAYGLSGDSAKAQALNERDLTPEQAAENQRFYQSYLAKNGASLAGAPEGIGFESTPESIRHPAQSAVAAAETPQKPPAAIEQSPSAGMPQQSAQPEVSPAAEAPSYSYPAQNNGAFR